MSSRRLWLAAIAAACLQSSFALAAEPLTLAAALRRAESTHPDLQGFAAETAGADRRRALAGYGSNPEIGLLVEDAFGTGSRSGFDSAQATLSYSQALELGGQRAGRLALDRAQRTALDARQTQRRRDALVEVTQRFIEAAADRERVRLAEQQAELAQKTLDAATRRVRAARAPLAEASRARAALAQATLQREHAEHEEQSARVALAVTFGNAHPDFGELQADLYALPALRGLPELRAALAASPEAQARIAEAAVHEAERQSALAAAGWKPTLTGGLRRYQEDDGFALVAGISLPFGSQRRARDEAGVAEARRRQGEAENRAAGLRAEELLFDRYQELIHAREALRLLEAEVLPALDEALEQTQYAYDRGRYGYLELSEVLRERATAQRERLDTAAHYHSLLAELERLTGEPLTAALVESRTGSTP